MKRSYDSSLKFELRSQHKPGIKLSTILSPFPECPPDGPHQGLFTGLCVEIQNDAAIKSIYENGFYGKGSRSRGPPLILRSFNKPNCDTTINEGYESLVLQLEEAFFLAYFLNVLIINDLNGSTMEWKEFLKCAETINSNFIEHFGAYLYLKSKNWTIKSGLKFGGDFLLYQKGPRFYHASFVVLIKRPNDPGLPARDMKAIQRVAESADKDVLFLEVTRRAGFQLQDLKDFADLTVSEIIIRRFTNTAVQKLATPSTSKATLEKGVRQDKKKCNSATTSDKPSTSLQSKINP